MAAIKVRISAIPDYYGMEGVPGLDGVSLEAGWVVIYTDSGYELGKHDLGPFTELIVPPGVMTTGCFYFLRPGVEVRFTPMYPASI